MNKYEIYRLIENTRTNGWKTCLYGLGKYGRNIGIDLFKMLGLQSPFITDKNEEILANYKYLENRKIKVNELLETKEDYFVIICVAISSWVDICKLFANNPNIHYVFIQDVIKLDEIVNTYYGVNFIEEKYKIAVFTCITGNYDSVYEPQKISSLCDYYLISDNIFSDSQFNCISVEDVVPKKITSPKDQNRFCKMHGYKIFANYDYSIYLDGSIQIIGDISEYINDIGYSGLAMLKHPYRKCIFEEGIITSAIDKSDRQRTINLMRKYANEGMPRNYGIFECGVIACNHKRKMGIEILERWYEEYIEYRLRDQFALPYILWKNGLPCSVIGLIENGTDVRKSSIAIKRINHI